MGDTSYTKSSASLTAAAIAAVLVAAFALLSGGERAATLGLTRHGQLVTVQDAGAADAVAAVAVSPGTAGQVLTVSDAGLPHWAAASGGSATQPTTLAAQARADALTRRGPVALLGTSSTGVYTANTADATPSLTAGSSGVITYYSPQAGGYGTTTLAFAANWGVRGWYMSIASGGLRLGFAQGVVQTADCAGAFSTIGWHSVAWAIASDGTSVSYSLDGAAVTTATLSTTPLTPVARDGSEAVYIASNNSSAGSSPAGVAYLAVWESVLSSGSLVLAASSPSAGAPTLPSTPAWEWAAAAFVGVESVTIDGRAYVRLGTPQIWMP